MNNPDPQSKTPNAEIQSNAESSSTAAKETRSVADNKDAVDIEKQAEPIPGNQTDQPFTADSAPEHGTDPSLLSDL